MLAVIQPDVTKWGGITGNFDVAARSVAAGKRYCPHFFGGGVSLLSSLHVLAAAGGTGLLEFDCHPNVGREAVVGDLLPVTDGRRAGAHRRRTRRAARPGAARAVPQLGGPGMTVGDIGGRGARVGFIGAGRLGKALAWSLRSGRAPVIAVAEPVLGKHGERRGAPPRRR